MDLHCPLKKSGFATRGDRFHWQIGTAGPALFKEPVDRPDFPTWGKHQIKKKDTNNSIHSKKRCLGSLDITQGPNPCENTSEPRKKPHCKKQVGGEKDPVHGPNARRVCDIEEDGITAGTAWRIDGAVSTIPACPRWFKNRRGSQHVHNVMLNPPFRANILHQCGRVCEVDIENRRTCQQTNHGKDMGSRGFEEKAIDAFEYITQPVDKNHGFTSNTLVPGVRSA